MLGFGCVRGLKGRVGEGKSKRLGYSDDWLFGDVGGVEEDWIIVYKLEGS